jgi:vitamin B12 transporter
MCLAIVTTVRAAAAEEEVTDEAIDVVVEGAPIAPSPRDPTPSSYRVGAERLAEPGLDLADALDRAPGVTTTQTGGSADPAFVSIRGGRSAQTPLYLSSIRLNDDITGQLDLSSLPPWMLHHVEIYRGHAPRWVDELGMGGAILLEPHLPRGTHASAAIGAGSFGAREGRAALSLGEGAASALVAVGHRAGDGDFFYRDDGGTRFDERDDVERRRENADHREIDGWAMGRMATPEASLTVLAHSFAREAGAPGLLLPGARQSRVSIRRFAGGVAAVVACAERWCSLEVNASYLATRYHLRDPRGELGQGRDVDARGARLAERIRLELSPTESWALGLGLGHTGTRLALDGDFEVRERAARQSFRPVVDVRWSPLRRLDLIAVAAVDCHTTRGSAEADGACGVLEPTGRAGVRYAPWAPVDVFANLGRYVRVPTLGEKYGVSAAVLGNPALTVEKGVSAEVGVRATGAAGAVTLFGEVVGFARFVDDLVGYRRASLGAVRPHNVASARVLGAEVVGGASLARHLTAELVLGWLDPRDRSGDRQVENDRLPYLAALSLTPSLVFRSPRWALIGLDEATLALRYRHQGPRVADPAGLVALPAQNLLEIAAGLAFSEVKLRARLENLLDDRTFDLVGFPLPGRAFHALVEVGW